MLAPCKLIICSTDKSAVSTSLRNLLTVIILLSRGDGSQLQTLQLILRFLLFRSDCSDFAHSHSQNHIIHIILFIIIQTLHYVAEIHLSSVSKDTFGGHNA